MQQDNSAPPPWHKEILKKILLKLLTGYVVQVIIIIVVLLTVFIFEFFASFYNRFLLSWIAQPNRLWAFLISAAVAYMLGTAVYTKRIWDRIDPVLRKVPIVANLIKAVNRWRDFLEGALKRGFILAPYHYPDSRSLGVVSGVACEEDGRMQIAVAFWNLPVPLTFVLEARVEILAQLTFGELIAYFLSGGFSFQELERRLIRMTLGEYIEKNLPQLLQTSKAVK